MKIVGRWITPVAGGIGMSVLLSVGVSPWVAIGVIMGIVVAACIQDIIEHY